MWLHNILSLRKGAAWCIFSNRKVYHQWAMVKIKDMIPFVILYGELITLDIL